MSEFETFWIDDWFVDPSSSSVTRGETHRRLRPRTMDLLVCLANQDGGTLLRKDALEQVWADVYVENSAVAQCISEIRTTFGDSAQEQRIVKTVPKRGYALTARVRFSEERQRAVEHKTIQGGVEQGEIVAASPSAARPPVQVSRLRAATVLPGLLVLVLMASLALMFHRSPEQVTPTVAVANFRVIDPQGPQDVELATTLTQLLRGEVHRSTDLHLGIVETGRTEAIPFVGAALPAESDKAVAEPSDSEAPEGDVLLMGSLAETEGSGLRVELSMIDVDSGLELGTLEATGARDELGLVAASLCSELLARMGIENRPRLALSPLEGPIDPESAYGRGLVSLDRGEFEEAAAHLEASLSSEPRAEIYLLLAKTKRQLGEEIEAAQMAERALELLGDEGFREHRLWFEAEVEGVSGHWDKASVLLSELVQFDEGRADYSLSLAQSLVELDRAPEARALVEAFERKLRAVEWDPRVFELAADVSHRLGEYGIALREAQSGARLAESHGLINLQARLLRRAAKAADAMGRPTISAEQLARSTALFESAGNRSGVAKNVALRDTWRRRDDATRLTEEAGDGPQSGVSGSLS